MSDIQKRLRFLEIYAAVSLIIFGVLAFTAFKQSKQKFTEIDVERLNLVEKNGQLRMVIANAGRMPDPIINGKAFKTERPPGMIFYNGLGGKDSRVFYSSRLGAKRNRQNDSRSVRTGSKISGFSICRNDVNASRRSALFGLRLHGRRAR